ncbi:hypothetical protein OIE66_22910 [Nonomuraea sp. NBC_01738]|uniref:hypothetical protein n=1 Tax=Nonomuraea sp. NBC_01738 TaxID=2976003 RepID=UPI002E0E2EC1|nr:hypothetical protein OIE66_22910 [Nonomuraea sp. NBC_01738]
MSGNAFSVLKRALHPDIAPGGMSAAGMRELMGFVVAELGRDAELRESVAGRSYAHPNGFDRISLYREPEGVEVRMHLWWSGVLSDETIHNHAWDFSSLVLTGTLRFQLLHGAPDGRAYGRYRSSMPPGGGVGDYAFTPEGSSSLEVAVDAVVPAGTGYRMHRDTYHRVLASVEGAPLTATVVVRGPVRKGHSHILVPRGTRMPGTRSMRHLETDEIVGKLNVLHDCLGQSLSKASS